MGAIFISYRRDDCQGEAGRLYGDLARRFGNGSVFMDVVGIEPGMDFRKVINERVSSCTVLLAVIGRGWLTAMDDSGLRRLDNPRDFVRLETASALKKDDIQVVPIPVHGAKMPEPEELPKDLQGLAYRQAFEMTHARWDSDVAALMNSLDRAVISPIDQGNGQDGFASWIRQHLAIALAATGMVVLVGIVWMSWYNRQPRRELSTGATVSSTTIPAITSSTPQPTRVDENPPPQPAKAVISTTVPAANPSSPAQYTMPAGTPLDVRVQQTVSNQTNKVGDSFSGTLVRPLLVDGVNIFGVGSPVLGTVVSSAAQPTLAGPPALSMMVTRVGSYQVTTNSREVNASRLGAAFVGGGGGGGALIGGLAGGGKGDLQGSLLRIGSVQVGSVVTFTLATSLTVTAPKS